MGDRKKVTRGKHVLSGEEKVSMVSTSDFLFWSGGK